MRELEADFRREYHARYGDVPADEAIRLAEMLDVGSAYLTALDVHMAWTRQERMLADINDSIERFLHMKSSAGTTEGAPTVARPWFAADSEDARRRAHETRSKIDGTKWEAV